MISIKELLNKIKWSEKFKKEEITILYFDRILKKNIEIPLKEIKIEGDWIITQNAKIPLHRVREVRKKDVIIWSRTKA